MTFKRSIILIVLFMSIIRQTMCQVDTTFIYNQQGALGPLDLRIAKSSTNYYYLQEGRTFSFREVDGVRTNSFLDMTAWDSKAFEEGNMREKTNNNDLFVMNYRLLKPKNYNHSYVDGYPLVILLHGLLERGNCADNSCHHGNVSYSPNENIPPASKAQDNKLLNNDFNLIHGGVNYLEANQINAHHLPDDPARPTRGFPGFVVVPQNLNGWSAGAVEDAIRLVRLLVKRYNIDETRIYINGISHGGHGAYIAMAKAPWLFAAGVLFSAADDADVISNGFAARVSSIPLWLFQGGQDLRPSPAQTEQYIKSLKTSGAIVRYTKYPQLGHGTWNKAFSEPDFFSWMLRQRKNNLHLFAGNTSVCKTTNRGAVMKMPEGFAAYQWELEGTVLANATGHAYEAKLPGIYRGRYASRIADGSLAWYGWSDAIEIVEKNPASPKVERLGTLHLPDPNGENSVRLRSATEHAHYNWHKEENLLNMPGTEDDTIRTATLLPAYGDGQYFLTVSEYDVCPSQRSDALRIFFSNRAPTIINRPLSLQTTAVSASMARITWEDVSDNESGFEIWRRSDDGNVKSKWQLISVSGKDSEVYEDNTVVPSTRYEYMIRAVNDNGRSNYLPSPNEPVASVIMPEDTQPPTSPASLVAKQIGLHSVRLSWAPSTDNAGIARYLVHINDDTSFTRSADTVFIVKDLSINTHYAFSVVAQDISGKQSDKSDDVSLITSTEGLYYQHTTGAWNSLDEIDWSLAEFVGKTEDFTLRYKTQEGYVFIQKSGVYQFRISSDDGSALYLNDSLLVSNDGIHNLTTSTGPVQVLQEGPHRITVDFFDYMQSDTLMVEYKGPDSEGLWTRIPAQALRSAIVTSSESTELAEPIQVFPNPAKQVVFISNEGVNDLNVEIKLVNSLGQVVMEGSVMNGPIELDVRALDRGMYLLKIGSKDKLITKKIVLIE
jgi:hypothetical protein